MKINLVGQFRERLASKDGSIPGAVIQVGQFLGAKVGQFSRAPKFTSFSGCFLETSGFAAVLSRDLARKQFMP
jgi:hypothetical protein